LVVLAKYCRDPSVEEAYSNQDLVELWAVLTKTMKVYIDQTLIIAMYTNLLQFVVTYNALYILTTILFKISLAIFFLRIVVVVWQRRLIYVSTGIYTVYGIFFIFLVTFRCGDPSDFIINAARQKCITNEVLLPLIYIAGGLNAVVDVIFATLPITILWNSHMPRQTKISVGILLSMGCIGSIASIIRIAYLGGLTDGLKFFDHAIDAGLLSVVEPGLAITAASLSALRPLFKSMVEKSLPSFFSGYSKSKHSTASNSKRHTSRSHRGIPPRTSFDDQKGFQVFDNAVSGNHIVIATSPTIEMDELSHDGSNTLDKTSSQGSLVEQHVYGNARTWVPQYSGKGVMMTRAVDVTEH
jgi:hypothetical protein